MANKRLFFFSFILALAYFLSVSARGEEKPNELRVSPSSLSVIEEEKVGPYQQPKWTASRRFPGTRSYLIPRGELEAEFWIRTKTKRDSLATEWLYQQEIEYGFANHLQFDFYINEIKAIDKDLDFEGLQFELRWALADWGKLPWNPTFYFEFHPIKNAPNKGEIRLLLSESLPKKFFWSMNLAFETELTGEALEHEWAVTAGLGHNLCKTFSLGAEAKSEWVDVASSRGSFTPEYYLGPSLQWQLTEGIHTDLVWFFGLNKDSNQHEAILILGVDL